jgi:anti-anti-sigma regulatory factor
VRSLGAKSVQRRSGCLVLLNPVAEVARVLSVAGMTQLMQIYHDSEPALAAVSAQSAR